MQNLWELRIQQGWLVGLALAAVALAVAVALGVLAVLGPISLGMFLLALGALFALGVSIVISYQLWGLVNAHYEMDRNALVIHWGGVQHQIPMTSVRAVLPGAEVRDVRMQPGLRWPGHFVGYGDSLEIGPILFFAVTPRAEHVIIRTDGMAYAISPQEIESFLQSLHERLEMGPTQEMEESSQHPAFLDWTIWKDRLALGLLLGSSALLLLLIGLLCWRYPGLPLQIALRVSKDGAPLLLAQASRIFYFALLGLIFLALNGGLGLLLYQRERTAAYFLWSGLLLLQGSLWAAVLAILAQVKK